MKLSERSGRQAGPLDKPARIQFVFPFGIGRSDGDPGRIAVRADPTAAGFLPVSVLVPDAGAETFHAENEEEDKEGQCGKAGAVQGGLAATEQFGGAGGTGDQAAFLKDFFEEEITQEERTLAFPSRSARK